jgi:hypothetical protein
MTLAALPSRNYWPRLLIAGVVLPATFVAIDSLLLDCLAGVWRTDWSIALTMAVFIIQIGAMGIVCGRWTELQAMRWILYAWCWLLIDFQTVIAWMFTGQSWWGGSFHTTSLFAVPGQRDALCHAAFSPARSDIASFEPLNPCPNQTNLSPQLQQPALVRKKNLARVEVLQAPQFFRPPVCPHHPAVRDQQLAELGRVNHPPTHHLRHGDTWSRKGISLESGRIHVSLLPALARQIFIQGDCIRRPRWPGSPPAGVIAISP